jgi:hypothetical protein
VKALAGLAVWCALASGAAEAYSPDDPLHGVDIGMSQTALDEIVALEGADLSCRSMSAITNRGAVDVQRCTADLAAERRLAAVLAWGPKGARVVAFEVQGPVSDASAVREQLVKRWGAPQPPKPAAAGSPETARWLLGARLLVLSKACRQGLSFCIQYSENGWARQAASAVGMNFAPP